MLVRDLRYALLRIRRSPGFALTAVIALALGTVAMELADPQLRQHLLNAQLALTIANFQDLPAQPQNTSMREKTSAAQENVSYRQDQLPTQTDETPYLGALSDPRYQKSKNMTGQFSTQHQLSRRATIDTRTGIIPEHVTRVDPLIANTRWAPTIDVQPDGVLPPGVVSQLKANAGIDPGNLRDAMYTLRSVSGIENSTLNLLIDANVRRATRVTVKVNPTPVNKIQILNLPGSNVVAKAPMKKLEGAKEAQ
jgi:hypothetical protein